jgi:hypothetical protein
MTSFVRIATSFTLAVFVHAALAAGAGACVLVVLKPLGA